MPLGRLGGVATSANSVRVPGTVAETGVVNGVHGAPCVFVSRATSLWGRGGDASMSVRSMVAGMTVRASLACWISEVARIEPTSMCASMADWRARKGVG